MTRQRVLLLDRSGYRAYRDPGGTPYLDPRIYDVTLATLPEKVGQEAPGELAATVACDMLNPAAVLSLADQLPAPDWVVTTGERFIQPAAALRQRWGLPGDTPAQALLLRDKIAMKTYFGAHGLRVPQARPIGSAAEASELLERFGKIVLKPVDAMGSTGVIFVDGPQDLSAAEHVIAAAAARGQHYQAEEFITGQVHHIDSIVDRGQPIMTSVSRYLDDNTVFPVGGCCRSAEVPPGQALETLLAFNRRLLATIGWFSGVSHHEVFYRPGSEPIFCEIAGRPGGGGVIPAFRWRYGRDLTQACLSAQLGTLAPAQAPPRAELTGWAVYYPAWAGVIAELAAPELPPAVIDFRLTKKPGDRVALPTSFGQGIAIATVAAPDQSTVAENLSDLNEAIRIRFADEPARGGGSQP